MNITSGELRNDFILEEEFEEKGVVLFDYNDDQLKGEFQQETDKILQALQNNTSLVLIISAHADSRGSEEYNLKLSQRRAGNIESYFIKKGIPRERIITSAFGESLIINRCDDGINCHEEDHSENRRVELKVQHQSVE